MSESPSIRSRFKRLGCCVVIPSYDNAGTLKTLVNEVLEYCGDVIVVNDGSTDGTGQILESFGNRIRVLTHLKNMGKGVALFNGLSAASERGFRYAITIDSDGQHFPSDLSVFADAIEKSPDTVLVGARNLYADGMSSRSTFANRFSNFWFRIETGIKLSDTQSGYRSYALEKINLDQGHFTSGYEFELEILVFSAWSGTKIANVPVKVYYPPEGERVSHFRPLRDFTKISILNTVLVLYCVFWKWPAGFFRNLTISSIKAFVNDRILHSGESNLKLAEAIMLGVFIGIIPVWGYQMAIAFFLAHLLKLNKIISVVSSNISIPPMIPFLLFGSYWTGCEVLGQPVLFSLHEINMAKIGSVIIQYVLGSFIFAAVCAVFIGMVSFLLLSVFRKNPVSTIGKE
jgi:glycosyltransferase involved in cell wall biosynthesis